MRRPGSRIALAAGCTASVCLLLGAPLGQAAPTRWGQHGWFDWYALGVQVRAHAGARHACRPRAHGGHAPAKPGNRARCHRARHGASSTKPTPGPAPPAGAGSGGLAPTLPGVPSPAPGQGTPGGSGSGEEGGTPPSLVHVQVTAVEYHYTLSRTTVPAGKIAIQFVDNGQDEHNLNVLSGEGEIEAAFPTTVSHGIREQTVNLRKGSFTLFCSLPEHEAKGMHATLTVQ